MQETELLTETLQVIEDETNGIEVKLGEVVEALNEKGFGPLLIAPSLLTILPTGAVPGIPALSAIFICLVSGQVIAGRSYPWIPKRLKEFSFKRKKLISAIRWAKPYTKKIDCYVHPRFERFSEEPWHPLIAAICGILAIVMAIFGFIPFLPTLGSGPINRIH